MRNIVAAAIALGLAGTVAAQSHDHHGNHAQPYAGLQGREIKALSSAEIEQLKSGAGMGFAQAAELNHYPGPKHILELSTELGLTDDQKSAATRAFEEMKSAAVELGGKIIQAETHLDKAFAEGSIDEDQLALMTAHIGKLEGELRAVHLKAHLAMRRILTTEQIATYDRLRGYESTATEN